MLNIGQVLNDTYRVIEQIGAGGGGIVYKGFHIRLKKFVAIKLIKDNVSGKIEDRAEADILKSLRNSYIPIVYDFSTIDGNSYTIMDFIEGSDFKKLINSGKRYSENQIIEWANQLCNAVEYLHSRKPPIIHSDIKPANIMLTPENTICLIDFNISAIFNEKGTLAIGGSKYYAAPEQIKLFTNVDINSNSSSSKNSKMRAMIDERTDIYSIGATLYFILTGTPPNSQNLVLSKIKSPALKKVIKKCMNENPTKRYQSVTDLRNDLNSNKNGFGLNSILSNFIPNKDDTKTQKVKPIILVQSDSEFISDNFVPDCSESEFNVIGNTTANIANGGIVATQGKYIYYSNHNLLMKYSTDNGLNVRICDDKPIYINVIGHNIYYVNQNDGKIYSIRTDGSKRKCLVDSTCRYLHIKDDIMYYINTSDNHSIYKSDVQLTFNNRIVQQKCSSYCTFKDRIFFSSEENNFKLASVNTYGKDLKIHDERPCEMIADFQNNLFYKAYDGSKYILSALSKEYLPIKVFNTFGISNYNIKDNILYIIADATSGFRMYKNNLIDNTVNTMVKNNICDSINIVNNYIFYHNMIENKIEKINL